MSVKANPIGAQPGGYLGTSEILRQISPDHYTFKLLKSLKGSSLTFLTWGETLTFDKFPGYTKMADVRSLLRNERAQRRINHQQATYSATGSLECSVCRIPLKSDQEVWTKHLNSTQHAMRAERLRLSTSKPPEQEATREVSNGSKKRKASDGEDNSRKRTKPVVDVPGGFFDEMIEANNATTEGHVEDALETSDVPMKITPPTIVLPSYPLLTPPVPAQVDEDEWAAFERDVARPPPGPSLPSALTAEATIIAAPMTAAELAAQAREDANTQSKDRREAELEGEKEDAARALEEEFDQMEDLEERVRKLREKREDLRAKRAQEADTDQAEASEGRMEEAAGDGGGGGEMEDEESDDDDQDEDDQWGGWGR